MSLDVKKLDEACAKADALSRRFAARSDLDPGLIALGGIVAGTVGHDLYHKARGKFKSMSANRAVRRATKKAEKIPGTVAYHNKQRAMGASNTPEPARSDVDWKKVGRKTVGYGARVAGRGLQAAGVATGVAGGIIGAPGAVPAAILGEWHAFPGHRLREGGKKLNAWGKRKTKGPEPKKVVPKRADIDPVSLALAAHLATTSPSAAHHAPVTRAHLGHRPPRRLPRPEPTQLHRSTAGGSRKVWSKPRVDAEFQAPKVDGKDASEWSRELVALRNRQPRPLYKLWNNPTPEQIAQHDPKLKVWNAEYRRAQKNQKKALELSNEAFRQHNTRGDGLSIAAALVAFLATASISTLVAWGMDKIEEAKSLVRIAATGKLAPKDVAQIRRAMDKLRTAERAAKEKRQPQLMHQRLEPRFDAVDTGDFSTSIDTRPARKDDGYFGLAGHVHPLTGTIFGATRGVTDLTAAGAATGTTLGGSLGIAGTAIMALAFLVTAATMGFLIKKGADKLGQWLDKLRLAKSGGQINAKDRVEIMAAIEKLKLAKYRSEAIGRGDAEEKVTECALRIGGRVHRHRKGMESNHAEIWETLSDSLKQRVEQDKVSFEVGFWTSAGRFVDRQEAARISRHNKPDFYQHDIKYDVATRGDFWKKPETGTALAKPQQSSPTEIGAFLSKAQQTKPTTAAPSAAAAPAAAAVAPSPAVAASAVPTRVEKPLTARQQWRAAKPLKPKQAGKRAYNEGVKAFLPVQAAERAKHPANKAQYKQQKGQWKEARRQYKQHDKAYNAFETNTPPPGSAEAKQLEAKKAAKLQQQQKAAEASARNVEIKKKGEAAKVEAKKLKRHTQQYNAFEREDPPPGSGAWKQHNKRLGTLPQEPGEARPTAAG
jgi:hypothetical protein